MTFHRNSKGVHAFIACVAAAAVLVGCSRDPNIRRKEYFDSGMRYFQRAKYREAAIQFQNSLQADPYYSDAHYELAQCFLKDGAWTGAYQELLRTLELDPKDARAMADLGKLLLAGRKFDDARERAQAALQLDPHSADAQMVLANADAAMGREEQGIAEAKTAVAVAPTRADAHLNLAILELRAGHNTEAEASFLKSIAVDPRYLPARLSLGQFYQKQQRWPEAETQLRAAIAAAPTAAAPRTALAALYLAEGRKEDAEQALVEAKGALREDPEGYRMLGDFYLSNGDTQKALGEFASLAKAHPKDLRVQKTYIQLLILANRGAEARTLNDLILKANPKDTDAQILRAEMLSHDGKQTEALAILQDATKSAPDNAVAHFQLGLIFAEMGSMQQAEGEWRTSARLVPSFVEAQRALATVALRRSDWDLLLQCGEQLIRAQANSPEGYVDSALAEIGRGDADKGEQTFQKALEVAPDDARAYTGLGNLRATQKRPDDALQFFHQALDRDPASSDALQGIVNIDLQRKDPAKALAEAQAQIAKSPSNSALYLILGNLCLTAKDLSQAAAGFQRAYQLDPLNVDAALALANTYAEQGSLDQAVGVYQRAAKDSPHDLRLYVAQGSLEETRGNWAEAEKLYKVALQNQSDDPTAANNLAYLLLEHGGDKDVALSLAQTARQRMPEAASTADTLAWAYYYQGAYSTAIALLQEAVKKSPDNPTYHYHLGVVFQKSNDAGHARDQFERALKLQPNPALSQQIRKAMTDRSSS
jgi:tetratricopeptide (TPR) repeat protein